MSQDHHHRTGCGCDSIFIDIIENAGRELTRRDFVRGAAAAAGIFAIGTPASAESQGAKPEKAGKSADTVYHGGPIVTMVKDDDRVQALAVKDGKILAAGSLSKVMTHKGEGTKLVDLKGKCLMPGFVDPHSHVVLQSVKFSTANLDPKPIGEVGSIADIQRILRDWIKEKKLKPGQWVIGWGYDDTGIKEMRHPNRDDLDAVSTDHPILLMHISCHLMAGNSKMLEEIGVNAQTPDPDGGKIQRKPGSNEPNGVLEEHAMLLVMKKLPMPTPEKAMHLLEEGLRFYSQAGITTAQDGATGLGAIKLLRAMQEAGKLPIDIVAYPVYKGANDSVLDAITADRKATGRFRLGGIKLVLDGSIQGYTAFLTEPYYVQPGEKAHTPDKCDGENAERIFVSPETHASNEAKPSKPVQEHRGFSSMSQQEVDEWMKRCDAKGVQVLAHTNGDAATDMLLKAVEKSRGTKDRPELRTVIIHAQTIRDDQLDFAARHGLNASFFPIHVYFWGDRHRDIFLGPQRAARIDPSRSALDRKMTITLHHDAPVAGIDMLNVVWTAVNRITSSGKKLGPEECITPFEALQAVTSHAAWQYFEEARKGTLEAGKLADMVILSDDPLAIDPLKIRDIKVLLTIKEGATVYQAKV